jgi:hypothetical protein
VDSARRLDALRVRLLRDGMDAARMKEFLENLALAVVFGLAATGGVLLFL